MVGSLGEEVGDIVSGVAVGELVVGEIVGGAVSGGDSTPSIP
jgi:hypothetical protein